VNPLAGKPLRCLIGAGDPPMGDDANIEVGYDVTKPSGRIRPKAPRALRFRCSIRTARPRRREPLGRLCILEWDWMNEIDDWAS
jgi:hypothetical protein